MGSNPLFYTFQKSHTWAASKLRQHYMSTFKNCEKAGQFVREEERKIPSTLHIWHKRSTELTTSRVERLLSSHDCLGGFPPYMEIILLLFVSCH